MKTIITDFEKSVHRACSNAFPDVNHKGCRFHNNSAIWRKIGELGLQSLFHNNAQFQEFVYKLYALSYVPVDKVESFWDDILYPWAQEILDNDDDWTEFSYQLEQFMLYFTNTWLRRRNGKKALFEPKTWNHYESVLSGDLETNNMLESHNRTWNSIVGHKSNVWSIFV